MNIYYGKPICGGTAHGELFVFRRSECTVRRYHITSSSDEISRFCGARAKAASDLEKLFEKAVKEIGEKDARIFSTQIIMLEDPGFGESVCDMIANEMINAETAVAQTADKYIQLLMHSDSEYIGLRRFDIRDISERVIRILLGMSQCELPSERPVILAARDLPPSDIVRFDCGKILGIATERGNEDSHAAIIARSKGIPAVMGIGSFTVDVAAGSEAVIDGDRGILMITSQQTVGV